MLQMTALFTQRRNMRNFWVRLIIKKHLFESSNEYQRSTIGDSPKLEIVFLSISGCFPSPTSWGGDRQQPVQPPPAGVARVGHWQYTGHQHDPFHLVECQAGPAWSPDYGGSLIFTGFYLSGKVLALPHTAPIKPAPPSERLDANFARISFY